MRGQSATAAAVWLLLSGRIRRAAHGQSATAAAVWLLLSGRLRRRAGHARRDDSFMEFYDISHESIISSSGAGLDLNYDKVQPTKITHFVKEPAAVR